MEKRSDGLNNRKDNLKRKETAIKSKNIDLEIKTIITIITPMLQKNTKNLRKLYILSDKISMDNFKKYLLLSWMKCFQKIKNKILNYSFFIQATLSLIFQLYKNTQIISY